MSTLDEVLADDKPAVEAPPPAEEPKGETPPAGTEPPVERVTSRRAEHRRKELAAQGRDPDTGKFLPKEAAAEAPPEEKKQPEAAPKAPPAQEMTEKEKAAFAAAADERRKRQALEQELAKYRQQPAAQPQASAQPAAQPAAEKKFWDDPEGFLQEWRTRTLTEAQQSALTTRLNTAEMLARHRYQAAGDFDTNVAQFAELMKSTPGLAQQWLASPDPAEFAYRTGKNHRELREAGGLDAMREKLEKELRVKIETELKEKAEAERAQRAAIPPSLSDVSATSAPKRPVFAGPTPLADILKA